MVYPPAVVSQEGHEHMPAPASPTHSSTIPTRPSYQQPSMSPVLDSNIGEDPSRSKPSQRQQQRQQQAPTTTKPAPKRDRRRGGPNDRFRDLSATFNKTKDLQFRKQIHSLQVEMALIASANPYGIEPLNDTPDEVHKLVEDFKVNTAGGTAATQAPETGLGAASAPGSIAGPVTSATPSTSGASSPTDAATGKWYSKFLQEVNRTKEERDAELAALMSRHREEFNRIKREHDFRLRFAHEESKALKSTIRERLVQNISNKKSRLMREKEHLDLADTNPSFLHPNQFSIGNPTASPGNRKTRHMRSRGDADEISSIFGGLDGGNGAAGGASGVKRKRKTGGGTGTDDDVIGSPRRSGTAGGNGNGNDGFLAPAERSRLRNTQIQHAPSYSIYSLFSEKELAMYSNLAHVAAVHFLASSSGSGSASGTTSGSATKRQKVSRANASEQTDENNNDIPLGDETSLTTAAAAAAAAAASDSSEEEQDSDHDHGKSGSGPVSSANIHPYHATRSTRNHNGANSGLLNELFDKPSARPSLPYFVLNNYHSRPNGAGNAPPLPSLMPEEMKDDLTRFFKASSGKPKGWMDEKLVRHLVQVMNADETGEELPEEVRRTFSMLHPDFPPMMDVHYVKLRRPNGKPSDER